MPTYEYECSNCGYKFDILQKMSDALLVNCPKCHQKKLKRLISAGAGIIFKGSGFYATDYRKKPKDSPKKQLTDNICPKSKQGCTGCDQK